jgi:hypothetical protein
LSKLKFYLAALLRMRNFFYKCPTREDFKFLLS